EIAIGLALVEARRMPVVGDTHSDLVRSAKDSPLVGELQRGAPVLRLRRRVAELSRGFLRQRAAQRVASSVDESAGRSLAQSERHDTTARRERGLAGIGI